MGLLVGGGGLLLSYDYLEPAGFTRSLIRRCMDKSPMPVDCTEAGAAAPIAPLDQLALWSAPALSTLSVGAPLVCWTQAGNLKDGVDAADAINTICAWLMDLIACPTEWNVLLTIRNDNPLYGGDTPPTVA
mmetsp:Transcript_68743/g.206189  ORF Transcript_68743/g.206189 Transcript_68743/m.206189 type:complete len:131 (-) Transcript_68743:105-497(-)